MVDARPKIPLPIAEKEEFDVTAYLAWTAGACGDLLFVSRFLSPPACSRFSALFFLLLRRYYYHCFLARLFLSSSLFLL